MPAPKSNVKQTDDTHEPEVETDLPAPRWLAQYAVRAISNRRLYPFGFVYRAGAVDLDTTEWLPFEQELP